MSVTKGIVRQNVEVTSVEDYVSFTNVITCKDTVISTYMCIKNFYFKIYGSLASKHMQ